MNVNEMSRKDFLSLPKFEWDERTGEYASLVIIPGYAREIHDSGYRCMSFVPVGSNNEPLGLIDSCSDVIHVDGIGGRGDWNPSFGVPKTIKPSGWSIDCLPKSGFLRMFCSTRKMKNSPALSSFEIYAVHVKQEVI